MHRQEDGASREQRKRREPTSIPAPHPAPVPQLVPMPQAPHLLGCVPEGLRTNEQAVRCGAIQTILDTHPWYPAWISKKRNRKHNTEQLINSFFYSVWRWQNYFLIAAHHLGVRELFAAKSYRNRRAQNYICNTFGRNGIGISMGLETCHSLDRFTQFTLLVGSRRIICVGPGGD